MSASTVWGVGSTIFELFPRLLVDVRATQNGEFFDLVGQRNGPAHGGAGPFSCRNNFRGACIKHTVIEGFQPDADILTLHLNAPLGLAGFKQSWPGGIPRPRLHGP